MTGFQIREVMEVTLLSPLAVGDPLTLNKGDKLFVHYPLNKWWIVRREDNAWVVRYRNRDFQKWSHEDTDFWAHRVFLREHEQEFAIRKAVIEDRIDGIRRRGGYDFSDFVFEVPFKLTPKRQVLDGSTWGYSIL